MVCVVGFMVIYFTFMETKGSTLEEIHQVAADWETVKRSLRRREAVVGKWNEGGCGVFLAGTGMC